VSEQKNGADKKRVRLSASRIETFQTCSALYYAKYLLRLPDPVGEAARRGSVAHDTLELLLNPRHKQVYTAAVLHNTCKEVPALWRVVQRFARKYRVEDDKSLDMIDGFIMAALKNEFFGPKGTYKALPEQKFDVVVEREDGRSWRATGFLDQLFFVEDETGRWLDIKDFKTGQVFKKDKLEYSIQALMYLCVSRYLYPEFARRRFRFQFVKGRMTWQLFYATEDQLNGFEWILTDVQRAMDAFTEKNALDSTRKAAGESCWLYGQECRAKQPRDYFALVDQDGTILAGADTEAELTAKEGQTIEKRHYSGCPAFYPR
jgi:hypothetical protein